MRRPELSRKIRRMGRMPKIVVYFDDRIPRNYLSEFVTFLRRFRFVKDVRIVRERQKVRRRPKTT